MPSPRNDTTYHLTPSTHDYPFSGEGSEYQRDPVFVDSSGRRARVARLVQFGVTGLCALYTTVLGLSLAGATAIAPSTLLPLPGVPSASFRIEPADEPDESEAAESPEKVVTSDQPRTTTPEAASWEPSLGAGPVETPSETPVTSPRSAAKNAPKPAPAPPPSGKDPVEKPASQPQAPPNPPDSDPGPEPSNPATPEPTPTPTPEPTSGETPGPASTDGPPGTGPDDGGGDGGTGSDGGTSDLPILGDVLDILTTFSVPSFAAGFVVDGRAG